MCKRSEDYEDWKQKLGSMKNLDEKNPNNREMAVGELWRGRE